MQGKRTLVGFILVSTSIFCVILVISMYGHFKRMESDFNIKKASLIKENLDLRDTYGSMETDIEEKTQALELMKEELDNLKSRYQEEVETLKKDNIALAQKIQSFQGKSLVELLREAMYTENDEKLKKYFEKVLYNIVLIKSGKNIELEPIVVAKKDTSRNHNSAGTLNTTLQEPPKEPEIPLLTGTRGKVLSVDNRYNLVVIDLGRKDRITEGQRLVILRNEREIAQAEIINVRYKIAAAFVDEIQYRYNIYSIREGDEVVVRE